MTREQAKTLWPIMQAFGEGKDIQCRYNAGKWCDVGNETGDLEGYEWRIKPEPREFWLGLHAEDGDNKGCVQICKYSVGPKPDDCASTEIIKVREVLE